MSPADEGAGAAAPAGAELAEIQHLFAGARDALSDDIVTRLSGAVAGGLDLLDRINRSGIAQALPAITRLVENGDLERLVGFVRLVAALEDSLSDDIVNRLATVATDFATLVDRLGRNPGIVRLIDLLGREEVQRGLIDFAEAACAARGEWEKMPPAAGGLLGLMRIAAEPGTQDALRFVSQVAAQLRRRPQKPA